MPEPSASTAQQPLSTAILPEPGWVCPAPTCRGYEPSLGGEASASKLLSFVLLRCLNPIPSACVDGCEQTVRSMAAGPASSALPSTIPVLFWALLLPCPIPCDSDNLLSPPPPRILSRPLPTCRPSSTWLRVLWLSGDPLPLWAAGGGEQALLPGRPNPRPQDFRERSVP